MQVFCFPLFFRYDVFKENITIQRVTIIPKIEKHFYEPKPPKKEDIIIKIGKYRFYFQNYYRIISLVNDFLLGLLYFGGSLSNLLGGPKILGQILFLTGSFFLIMRPILKILRSISFYNEEKIQKSKKNTN